MASHSGHVPSAAWLSCRSISWCKISGSHVEPSLFTILQARRKACLSSASSPTRIVTFSWNGQTANARVVISAYRTAEARSSFGLEKDIDIHCCHHQETTARAARKSRAGNPFTGCSCSATRRSAGGISFRDSNLHRPIHPTRANVSDAHSPGIRLLPSPSREARGGKGKRACAALGRRSPPIPDHGRKVRLLPFAISSENDRTGSPRRFDPYQSLDFPPALYSRSRNINAAVAFSNCQRAFCGPDSPRLRSPKAGAECRVVAPCTGT